MNTPAHEKGRLARDATEPRHTTDGEALKDELLFRRRRLAWRGHVRCLGASAARAYSWKMLYVLYTRFLTFELMQNNYCKPHAME